MSRVRMYMLQTRLYVKMCTRMRMRIWMRMDGAGRLLGASTSGVRRRHAQQAAGGVPQEGAEGEHGC